MLTASVFLEAPAMASAREETKGPKTENVRVKAQTAAKIRDIAEARGIPQWKVMEELLAASLPARHSAIQGELKTARELQKKLAEVHQRAQKRSAE